MPAHRALQAQEKYLGIQLMMAIIYAQSPSIQSTALTLMDDLRGDRTCDRDSWNTVLSRYLRLRQRKRQRRRRERGKGGGGGRVEGGMCV